MSVRNRCEDLGRALDLAEGRFDPGLVEAGRETLNNVGGRAAFGDDVTVAACFGATGSGKSSLVNALTGSQAARVAATRPTTTQALAVGQDLDSASELLDWMKIYQRAQGQALPTDVVLVDLPDIDSVIAEHRALSHQMAQVVDVLIWVLDPQKYADAVLHDEFVAPLAHQAEVTLVVLNQTDRLDPAEVPGVAADIQRLMLRDGIADAEVHPVSARTGAGIDQLRHRLRAIAAQQRAARIKAEADITHAADQLLAATEGHNRGRAVPATDGVIQAAAAAAGQEALSGAVQRSFIRSSSQHGGWPFTRWLTRLRPDPLQRLHLGSSGKRDEPAPVVAVSSLPEPTPVQAALLRSRAQDYAHQAGAHLPPAWRTEMLADVNDRLPTLVDELDSSLAQLHLPLRPPLWWKATSLIQLLGAALLLAGLGWLLAVWVAGFFQLHFDVPTYGYLPVPTLLLIAGLIIGGVTALCARIAARRGGQRRARKTAALIRTAVAGGVERELVAPVTRQLDDYDLFLECARRAAAR